MKMKLDDLISRKAVLDITTETGALETQRRVQDLPAVLAQIPVGTDLLAIVTPGTYVSRTTICRAVTLLTAAKERLEMEAKHCDDAMPVTTHYDDADCDGYCLLEDIKQVLEEFVDQGMQPGMEGSA